MSSAPGGSGTVVNSDSDSASYVVLQRNEPVSNDLCIVVRDLWKTFKGSQKPVLRGVNLTVPTGCVYALLGPSGCGKTTLLNMLLDRLMPSSGSIQVFGTAPGSAGVPG